VSTSRLDAPPETLDGDPPVHTFMSRELVGIVPEAALAVALRLMVSGGVRHLLVMDGDRCRGLVLEHDVARVLAGAAGSVPPLVGEFCRRTPRLGPTDRRSAAATAMHQAGIDAAIVVGDGRLLGIVTATDVLRSLAAGTG
jgi:CBS domain-containing protein